MFDLKKLRQEWSELTSFDRFEQVISRIIMVIISIVIIYSLVVVIYDFLHDITFGIEYIQKEVLQDIFGSVLTILILLEFNRSIAVGLAKRSGVIQTRIIVLIAILVVARKLILLDFSSASMQTMLGLGGLALALGVLYWLMDPMHSGRLLPGRQPDKPAP